MQYKLHIFFMLCDITKHKNINKPSFILYYMCSQLSQNNFSKLIHVKSKNEIGSLAKSINYMSEQLKETIKKLQQEIEKVKKLESLRKDFVNQFTYEMKTPLSIINGYSELIDEAESKEERERYLEIIHYEIAKINQLIQSMLN